MVAMERQASNTTKLVLCFWGKGSRPKLTWNPFLYRGKNETFQEFEILNSMLPIFPKSATDRVKESTDVLASLQVKPHEAAKWPLALLPRVESKILVHQPPSAPTGVFESEQLKVPHHHLELTNSKHQKFKDHGYGEPKLTTDSSVVPLCWRTAFDSCFQVSGMMIVFDNRP